jgi:hypothetical protein
MNRLPLTITSMIATLITACGGSSRPADDGGKGQGAADPVSTCRTVVERQRACTDHYVPALVDLRIKLDRPAGTAARAKEEGHEATVARAKAEWTVDTTDDKIAQDCSRVSQLPPERLKEEMPMAEACLAKPDCPTFTECIIRVEERNLGGGP